MAKAVEIKHSGVSQGPFALRCAKFGGNVLAPSETLVVTIVCDFGGHPFRRRLRITHDATVRE